MISEVNDNYMTYVEALTMSYFTAEVMFGILRKCIYNFLKVIARNLKQAVLRSAHAAPEGPGIKRAASRLLGLSVTAVGRVWLLWEDVSMLGPSFNFNMTRRKASLLHFTCFKPFFQPPFKEPLIAFLKWHVV